MAIQIQNKEEQSYILGAFVFETLDVAQQLRHPWLERLRKLDFDALMREQLTGDPSQDAPVLRALELRAQSAAKV